MKMYDVFIPSYARNDEELSALEKLLYGDLISYINWNAFNENGEQINYCNEHDKYFADVYNVSEDEIVKALYNLIEKDYISIGFFLNENNERERRIFVKGGLNSYGNIYLIED